MKETGAQGTAPTSSIPYGDAMAIAVPSIGPLPPRLSDLLQDFALTPLCLGSTGAKIFFAGPYVLKTSGADHGALHEARRLKWLSSHVAVPDVVFAEGDYMLMTRLGGIPATDSDMSAEDLAELVGKLLKSWHQAKPESAAFDSGNANLLADAARRVALKLVDPSSLLDDFPGETPESLLERVRKNRPAEDPVLIHGNFCLSNLHVNSARVVGMVDVGQCGFGDAYRDLALASKSLRKQFGRDVSHVLASAYGIAALDQEHMHWHEVIDALTRV